MSSINYHCADPGQHVISLLITFRVRASIGELNVNRRTQTKIKSIHLPTHCLTLSLIDKVIRTENILNAPNTWAYPTGQRSPYLNTWHLYHSTIWPIRCRFPIRDFQFSFTGHRADIIADSLDACEPRLCFRHLSDSELEQGCHLYMVKEKTCYQETDYWERYFCFRLVSSVEQKNTHGAFHIFDPSSLQNDSELYEAQTYETYGQLSWNQLQGMGKNWMSKEENVMKELRKVSCNPVICGW